ncbi:TetR/AcrR family transcriptional regulator [Lactobacillus gasseri]|uniref:TetR/AcrR family transcriptional regulator n=1 Tax=Lactobacillus gasseri TaxID=1596 RepID=UPI0002E0EA3D
MECCILNKYHKKSKKTDQIIESALLKLMDSSDLNKITMNELADMANINRVTIYRHFNDKWAIIEQIEARLFTALKKPHQKMLDQLALKSDNGIEYLTNFLQVFKDNLVTIRILISSNGDLSFSTKLMDHLLEMEGLSHSLMHLQANNDLQELFSYYSISALIGIIRFWTIHPNYSAKEMATFFFKMRNGELTKLS